ncbi:MAG: hypothetical protein PHU01_14030, partial [Desulfuromonadaceae bacterium]|nr:hypothetical protein [Desulfuromonadaceae bacterium]
TTEKRIVTALSELSSGPVLLELEQVLVKAGAIQPKDTLLSANILQVTPPPPPKETLASLHLKSMGLIREACDETAVFLAPWPIKGCAVTFSDGTVPATLRITVGRDFPLNEQEERWLALAVNKKLADSVVLKTSTSPLFSEFMLDENGVPDESGKKELEILKGFTVKKIAVNVTLNYPAGGRRFKADNLKKAEMLRSYMIKELAVPPRWITLSPKGNKYRITLDSGAAQKK